MLLLPLALALFAHAACGLQGAADHAFVGSTLHAAAARQLHATGKAPNEPLIPTFTNSPVIDIKWLPTSADMELLAWTKSVGAEVGGLWYSNNGARNWVERTPSLAMCPPDYPYLFAGNQACYKSPESVKKGWGDSGSWCALPRSTVADQIPAHGTWCSNGCPTLYPNLCASLNVCYRDKSSADVCSGLPGTWCALPGSSVVDQVPKWGSMCGNNATKGGREPVEILTVFADAANPKNVVVFGTGSYIWTSNDSGQTFFASQTALDMPRWRGSGIKSYKVHPWHDNWLLILVKRQGCGTGDRASQGECPYDLLLTKELFNRERTWLNLTAQSNGKIAGFVDFDWAAALCPDPKNQDCIPGTKITEDAIFATMYRSAGEYDQPWDKDVHFGTSSNYFVDFQINVYCGNMFEVIGKSIYLAYANSCPTDIRGNKRSGEDKSFKGIILYTSQDGGSNFVQACLPVALKQEGYELMATHDGTGAIVIAEFLIFNGFMDVPASSVYTAGPHHALFSLSLTDAFRADYGFQTDFARIEGLPGVYIANQMVPRMDGSDYFGLEDAGTLVQSRITFNGGGNWSPIPAPTNYNYKKCNRCTDMMFQDSCALHLRGMSTYDSMTSAMPAVYSNPSAPGFIMATGVTAMSGMGLLDDPEGTCTWLSTDGGVTWSDVADDAYIYEYADWGGVIVMAKTGTNVPADEVRYSLDYGLSWTAVPLATALLVDNIRVEPDGQRAWVIIHGRACEQSAIAGSARAKCSMNVTADGPRGAPPGIMYTLDIKALNPDLPAKCYEADYEQFSVPSRTDAGTSTGTPACTLGKVMRVKRRKAGAGCFNGPDFQRGVPQNTTCNCTDTDIECDYGYFKSPSGKCTEIQKNRMPQCPVVAGGLYTVSKSGKRLVHADVCSGIDAVIADTDGAGKRSGGGGGGGGGGDDGDGRSGMSGVGKFFLTLLILLLVAGPCVAWWMFYATERQRDGIRDAVSSAVGAAAAAAAAAYHSVRDRIRGRPADLNEHDMGYFQPLSEVDKEAGIFTLK